MAGAAQSPFAAQVYPALEKANCRGCHVADGVASATRLHFPEPDATPAQIETFGRGLARLGDLLVNKPTLRVPHTGGQRVLPGSETDKALAAWVEQLKRMPAESAATGAKPATVGMGPVLRRLTHSQYNWTVRDLLGDESRPADQFPAEDFVNGFKGQYQAQSIGPLLADAYSAAAEKLARSAFRGGDEHHLIPCKPAGPSDAACRAAFVRTFGRRAFRRPLRDAEAKRYDTLFAQVASRERDFLKGAQAVVETMLQSPAFLYRVEGSSDPKTRGFDAASRLSYFYWESLPDEALLKEAEAGHLNTPAGLERVARAMLENPKSRRSVDQFVSEWLRFDRVVSAVKDRRLFPQFTPELAVAMTEETRRLIADAVWNDRNFMRIYDADYAFLTGELASLYGLKNVDGEFERVAFPADTDRAGILGSGAFMALTSKPSDTSPTARGLFVREQLLCQHVPDPPPGVNANLPPVTEAKPMTNRERMAVHLTNPSCASCHNLIDPIGFGLERYDAIGRRHEKLKLTVMSMAHGSNKETPKTFELELNTAGTIAGLPNSNFSSPRELGKVLAQNPQCQECAAKQLFRYAVGRYEALSDRPVIRRSFEDFQRSGFHFKELMIAIAKWSEFPPGAERDQTE
jgi:hypothetical protein